MFDKFFPLREPDRRDSTPEEREAWLELQRQQERHLRETVERKLETLEADVRQLAHERVPIPGSS